MRRLYLWEKDVEMVSRECGENRTLLKEGYLFLFDNVNDNYNESKRSANFSLYKNGEIVTQSNLKEGDFFYYNRTIDGNEYIIIKFKVVNIFSADGTWIKTKVMRLEMTFFVRGILTSTRRIGAICHQSVSQI